MTKTLYRMANGAYLYRENGGNIKAGPLPPAHDGRYVFEKGAIDPWPGPPPSSGNGMDHEIDLMAARVIGYPGGSTWFLNSRLRPGAMSDQEVATALAHPDVGDAVWMSLSTGNRAKMGETPFDCRTNWQAVVDRMGFITERGVQVIPELGTQEFYAQTLGGDVSAYEDYTEDIAGRLKAAGLCKLAFPFREMPDHEAWKWISIGSDRVTAINMVMRAMQAGFAGSSIRCGIHLRSDEAPDVGMLSGIANPYWLAQVDFGRPINQVFEFKGDNHSNQNEDSAGFLQYWAVNRAANIPGLKTIAFEHSLPPNSAGYPGIPSAQAQARGQYILDNAPAVTCDLSGGARR